ncbi:MAG: carboxypeptidase-like regulatory domain-containing protein [Gemmatimonadota bacterium]
MIERSGRQLSGWAALLLPVLWLVGATPQLAAQGLVMRGVVVDEQTRLPVVAAALQLLAADGRALIATITDKQGRFQFSAPSPGAYKVRAERMGYFPKESGLLSIAAGAAPIIELPLSPRPVKLDSLMVSAKPETRPLRITEQLIHGRLLDDDTREPITGGTIELREPKGKTIATTITDQYGLFRLVTPKPGSYRLRGERIGYHPAEQSVLRTKLGDTIRLDFHLSVKAVLLAPMLVVGSAKEWASRHDRPAMQKLYDRMERFGNRRHAQFIIRDTIDAYDKRRYTVTQMLQDKIVGTPTSGPGCNGGAMYLNGLPLPIIEIEDTTKETAGRLDLDSFVLAQLEVVEVYLHPTLPAEFMAPQFRPLARSTVPPCRLTVLWSRR